MTLLVKIKQGFVEGREDISVSMGRSFYSFLGIPYGKPPVGELRFQPPLPADGWEGIYDATYDRNRAFEVLDPESLAHHTIESEDCLYLNVFVPKKPDPQPSVANGSDEPAKSLKPVMVNIHGGGNHFGTGNMDCVSPDHLSYFDAVLVSMNYRLHILGFLNLKTSSCSGNCGSKDQILALKWVQENIESFGGDPNNVTIYGASSGGNAVHLLTLSPLAEGLFHKAIVESGTIIGPWLREDQIDVAFEIAQALGFKRTDKEELLKFLKTLPAEVLVKEASRVLKSQKEKNPARMDGTQIFVPSIENPSKDAFLPDYPINLMKKAKPVPLLAGVAAKEGVTILFGLENSEKLFTFLKEDFAELVRGNVPCKPSSVPEIVRKVKEFYDLGPLLGEGALTKEFKDKIVEIYSHLYFRNLYKVTEGTVKDEASLFLYQFCYKGSLNVSEHWNMGIDGALHADEVEYITLSRGLYPDNFSLNVNDYQVIKNLCVGWTNFATFSEPQRLPYYDAYWKPHFPTEDGYMEFGQTCKFIETKIWEKGLEFWNNIFEEFVDWSDDRNTILQL